MKPLVVILMGSKTDLSFCQKIKEAVELFGLETNLRIGSAHKTSKYLLDILKECEADPRPKVYITVAGRSNALSGFIDGLVSAPVIACPPPGDSFGGADIYSSLRMPSGISPAVVLEPVNAALFTAKILGISNSDILEIVKRYQAEQAQIIIDDDRNLNL